MASVISDIKAGNISGLYLFYGEEAFKKRYYKELLKNAIVNGNEINYSGFEGKNINWESVYDAVSTMPFFADRRLIVIENSGKFKAKQDKEADSEQDKGNDLIERIIHDAPESACVAFFEDSAAKNKRIYKLIASKGVICECSADTEETLINWLARSFANHGKKVRKSTMQLLTGRVGLNYDMLSMETEKLISYTGDRDVIEDADVLAVTSENIESKIFDLLGAVSEKNVRQVLKRYYELLENKEHPFYIMAMLRIQLRTMLQVKELADRGLNPFEISKETGKPQFAVKKTQGYLRNFRREQIISMLDQINETDRKCKRGLITDQLGLELLLINFSC